MKLVIVAVIVMIIRIFYWIIWARPHDEIRRLEQSLRETTKEIDRLEDLLRVAKDEQYKYQCLSYLYPEAMKVFSGETGHIAITQSQVDIVERIENLFEVVDLLRSNKSSVELMSLKNANTFLSNFIKSSESNLTAIPYMAGIMADYETYGLEDLAKSLDWGYDQRRLHKVKTIQEIRKDAKNMVEKNKEAQYQLAYLLNLFPNLEDIVETDYEQLPVVTVDEFSENYDCARNYLKQEEYLELSRTERNQLALDRYLNSHSKSKWQIGRDYEMYIGYIYSTKGFDVDYFGSYMGLEDLGRDLIAKKGNKTLIVQCKYWSNKKEIHEKHITQLYGTKASYCIEHRCDENTVKGILITNIKLSPMAKKMARYLGIEYAEGIEKEEYPCIKCNIGRDEFGAETKIYHLPFDQQYDSTKIKNPGEFFAMTVAEAEAHGFRRAFKWYGSK